MDSQARLTDLSASLARWAPPSSTQLSLREEYASFLATHGVAALERDGGPEHITASLFVLTPDLQHILLVFHRKAQLWLQMGGHLEPGDPTAADAGLREGREECGLMTLTLALPDPVDLDRHALGHRFACQVHWDVGYLAFANLEDPIAVSDESEQLRWWPVEQLADVAPTVLSRLESVLATRG